MSPMSIPADLLRPGRPLTLAGVADGAEGLVVADLARTVAARATAPATTLTVVCRDGPRMAALAQAVAFFAPEIEVITFPAWDCLPYDRVSPHAGVVAERMAALTRLVGPQGSAPRVLITTVNAALQRVPAKDLVARQSLAAAPGNMIPMQNVVDWLELNGFMRASTVREPGDYAVRGGIVDLFAPGMAEPVRLDFFGDTLESIRSFDPESQRTSGQLRSLNLVPVAEFQLTRAAIQRFRQGYLAAFGAARRDDLLYEAVSEGRRHPGMEHWLPLFHERARYAVRLCAGLAHRPRAAGGRRGQRAAEPDRGLLRGAPAGGRRRRPSVSSAAPRPPLSHRYGVARTPGRCGARAHESVRGAGVGRPGDRHQRAPGPKLRGRARRAERQRVRRRGRPRAGAAER